MGDGGGAAEEGGQHQAHLRVPGRGGHQEICWGSSLRGLIAQWFPGKTPQPLPREIILHCPLTIILSKQNNLLKIFYVLLSVYSVQLLSVYKLSSKLNYNGNLKYCYLYFSNQLFSRAKNVISILIAQFNFSFSNSIFLYYF